MSNQLTVKSFFDETEKYLHKDYGILIRQEMIQSSINQYGLLSYSMIDIGCGNGMVSIPLLDNAKHLTLVDLSQNMIDKAQGNLPEQYASKVKYKCCSLGEIDPTTQFDIILAIGLFAHLPDIKSSLPKLKSLLNKNGLLFIQFSEYNHFVTRLQFLFRNKNLHKLNKINYESLCEYLSNNDLVVTKEIKYANILPGMGKLPDSWLYKMVKYISRTSLLSFLNSEYLLVVQIKSRD